MSGRIIILTGERDIGKSTVCQKTVDLAQAEGYTCAGIITPRREGGKRDVVDVRTGDIRPLTLPQDIERAVVQGRFRFDPETLAWGNRLLGQATPCDLLMIDEIGPLELIRGRGWTNALHVLQGEAFTLALVVVRDELLVDAQFRLPQSATTVMRVTARNRDTLPADLLHILEAEAAKDGSTS